MRIYNTMNVAASVLLASLIAVTLSMNVVSAQSNDGALQCGGEGPTIDIESEEVVICPDAVLTPVPCTEQTDVEGPTVIQNTDSGDYFDTIQDAIDDCDTEDGHTIEVGAGTYNENLMIDKQLSLLGPNQSISAVVGTRVPEASLTEAVRISETDNVTLSGFELTGIDSQNFTIYVYGDSNGFTFNNNRFINNTKVAIKTGLTSVTNNITIEGNLIDTVTASPNSGMQLGGVTGDSSISNNKITTTAYGGIVIDGADGLTIAGNHIENIPQQGIQLAGVIGDVTIENNTISNANTEQKSDKGAIRIYGSGVTGALLIKNNTIEGGHNGIAIKDGEDITGKNIVITENDILLPDTGEQIYHGGTGELALENNWWGVDTGIQSVNEAASIDSDPWLCGPFATNPASSIDGSCAKEVDEVVEVSPRSGGGYTPRDQVEEPTPQVLGAATTTDTETTESIQCGMYLNDYLRIGADNSTWEVLKLQLFLASQQFFMMNVGEFDAATEAAVRQYQADNSEVILQPWIDAGIVNDLSPSGYVYKTTRYAINTAVCPGSEAMPTLP